MSPTKIPPSLHRNNAAEKSIGTFKDHLIAIICSCNPQFLMHLWCRIVRQATTTLNHLRQSYINPRLSAKAQLNGAFDYNKSPLAPPETRVIVYENPEKRRTWEPHGIDGCYISSVLEHYRCHTVYITKMRAERISRTVEFFSHGIEMPHKSSGNNTTEASRMLTEALMNLAPASPFLSLGNEQMWVLHKLSDIFSTAAPVETPKLRDPAPSLRVLPRIQIRAPPRVQTTP